VFRDGHRPKTTHNFFCDGKSLLQRIQQALNRSWVNPLQCLAPDFDLESGMLDTLASLSVSFKFPWVKTSHQDDNAAVHLLPWTTQMNPCTGSLATDCLDNHACPSKIAPFIHERRNDQSTICPASASDNQAAVTARKHASNGCTAGMHGMPTHLHPCAGKLPARH
jgi:hypothetical protein